MKEPESVIEHLEHGLEVYPPDRYPIQHATARFHLGVALTDAARLEEAEASLRTALELFDPETLPAEHAKCLVALGAVLRADSCFDESIRCFETAARLFEDGGMDLERGAALFNLGLVHLTAGNAEEAMALFDSARHLLDPERVPAQAAAATRELGSALLSRGRFDRAVEVLDEAVALAERSHDLGGVGAAYNARGLALLGAGRVGEAIEDFRRAAGANPLGVRPEAFAMSKANAAVAYERDGALARARLAARQALAVRAAAGPVREQAAGVVERLGVEPADIVTVLDGEPRDAWAATIRDELARWLACAPEQRRDEARAWIEGQLSRPETAVALAEAWLGSLLELPPEDMEAIIRSVLEALGASEVADAERFRAQTSSAMVRFHPPQWMRLKDAFNRLASALDQEPSWT